MDELSSHYQNYLRTKIIEKRGGKPIGDGVLPILANIGILANTKENADGTISRYLSVKVKQMIFHMLYPDGYIGEEIVKLEGEYCEVTVPLYMNRNDDKPIASYKCMGLFANVYEPISPLEKVKKTIEMTKGSSLSRAFTRLGIGLEFYTELDEIETGDDETTKASVMNVPTAKVETSLETPKFEQPSEEQPIEKKAEEKKEKKASKPVKVAETKPVKEETTTEIVENNNGQMEISSDKATETTMTLEVAYATKAGIGPYKDMSLKEMVDAGEERKIWMLLSRVKDTDVATAVKMVVADIRNGNKDFDEFVKSKEK